MTAGTRLPPKPLDNSYWVEPGRLLAGEYPGGRSEDATRKRVRQMIESGIDCFIDLTAPGELEPYDLWLPGVHGRSAVGHVRKPIPDHSVPGDARLMVEILDEIDAALGAGRRVYVHCRAGIGRTGTVVGCWLARRGFVGTAALQRLNELWLGNARARTWPSVPETDAQTEFVLQWSEAGGSPVPTDADSALANTLRDRYRGALVGLAVGDALGQVAHHRRPGTFTPVGDLQGGGPFQLPAGAWTDETAMAMCLAESLVDLGRSDPADQAARYLRWQREGHWSSTGQCLGISAATAKAVAAANWARSPFAGSHDPQRADKEPLARIVPVVAMLLPDPEQAIAAAVDVARVTHQAPATLDAVRYFAALLVGALQGASRRELTQPMFSPVEGLWRRQPLRREIEAVARGSWVDKPPTRLTGAGQAPHALEAVLSALDRARSFREGALMVVNLGGDSDTQGAIYGQLAGAVYGSSGIPPAWRAVVARGGEITALADALLEGAFGRIA